MQNTRKFDRPSRRALLSGALFGMLAATQPRLSFAEPGVTDTELFAALDLPTPELQAVRAAVMAQDTATAKKALCAYFRERTRIPWEFDPNKIDRATPYNRAVADAAVAGKVIRASEPAVTIGEIDWQFGKTNTASDSPFVSLLRTTLNRMPFWDVLGDTYWGTGDEKYAQAWVQQMRKWVMQQPRPEGSVNGQLGKTSWLTIDAGLRMANSWPRAYHRFLHSSAFTDDDLIVFLKSCWQQGQHLRKFATNGNWLTMEMNGLYTLACVFPEFKEAKDWRTFATQKLYEDQKVQFLPDGAQVEGTPGYHNIAINNILGLYNRAELMGRLNELPADYRANLENAYNYDLYLMAPDRTLPKFNDSWADNVPLQLSRAAQLFPKRSDFLWISSDGKAGTAPAETSHAFPYVGYFVMRSGWEADANYLAFDAGPLGYAHMHQDKLNVVLWAYGRSLLFDSGGGAYDTSIWRKWATDTPSHNTVLVDGKAQRRPTTPKGATISRVPLPDTRWTTTPTYDFAAGVYKAGYGSVENKPVQHVRRVLFLKPDIFLVADTLTPQDGAEHSYEARWHLLSTTTKQEDATKAVTTTDTDKPNLCVVPLFAKGVDVRTVSAQREGELMGWEIRKEKDPPNVPATTVVHSCKGKETQHLLTLLLPLKAGTAEGVKTVRTVGPNTVEVSLVEGRLLRVEVSADPTGAIVVQEQRSDGSGRRETTAQ
jgi:hypothetical protein